MVSRLLGKRTAEVVKERNMMFRVCGTLERKISKVSKISKVRRMSGLILLFGLLLSPGLASGQDFIFNLAGNQEVPAVGSPATGGCMGQLDQVAAEFFVTCSHNVGSATLIHIHNAPAGANGPVVFDIGDPNSSPLQATWAGMTMMDIANLLAGNLYINIHSAGRSAGEIRGQILPRTADSFWFFLDGSQQVPPDTSTATGTCHADLNDAATQLSVDCTHNVMQPTAVHIHNAPIGANGPIVHDFGDPTSPVSGIMPMTPLHVAELVAGFFYVNIHSVLAPEEGGGGDVGEIRGQIIDIPAAIPTLPQWGTILLVLSLLALATWQLASQPVLLGAGTTGGTSLFSGRHLWLSSLLLGQGVATLGLLLYALLVGPLVTHDGLGTFLSGLLLGVMIEGYRRSRSL